MNVRHGARHRVGRWCGTNPPSPSVIQNIRGVAALLGMAGAELALTGCDRLSPSGSTDTMTLLRSGSEKVCVASDVQAILKTLILPKADQENGDTSDQDRLNAIAKLSISYSLTTLQHFDMAVAKANCTTTVTITGPTDQPFIGPVAFEVSPAAENPGNIVVSGFVNEAHGKANELVAAVIARAQAERAEQDENTRRVQETAQQAQQQAQLAKMVNDRWLVGVWMLDDAHASTCATSSAVRFGGDHSFSGPLGTGRWTLTGTAIHLVGARGDSSIDEQYRFSEAGRLSARAGMDDTDAGFSLRRCTRANVQGAPGGQAPASDMITDQAPR